MPYPSIRSKLNFFNPRDALIQAGISQGMVVAELGCGPGHFVFEAAKLIGDEGIVFAIDVQKPVLNVIKSKMNFLGLHNVKPIWADLEVLGSTKIKDSSVDLAILTHTLYQAKNHKAMLKEAYRMLKEKGKLLIIEWKKTQTPIGPPVEMRIDKEKLISWLEELNFKITKDIKTDNYHYGLLAEKL